MGPQMMIRVLGTGERERPCKIEGGCVVPYSTTAGQHAHPTQA